MGKPASTKGGKGKPERAGKAKAAVGSAKKGGGTASTASKKGGTRASTRRHITQESDTPVEVSSKVAPADLPVYPEPAKKKRRQRRKLDDDVLEAITVADVQGDDGSEDPGATDAAHASYTGTRKVLDGASDTAPKRRVRSKDQRRADGGVTVKRLRITPSTQGRSVPKEVKSFLQDHFYGDRLRRTSVLSTRRRGMRPARSFVAK
eukprot:m.24685 g.24685  ORF g.24685 m.24685 type:complete len:206 (+) comp11307_c0_seq1:231-848(+)